MPETDSTISEQSLIRLASGHLDTAAQAVAAFASEPRHTETLVEVAKACVASIRAGGKLLACGNGGSACQAMHLCEELTGRFRHNRPPIAAISCSDAGHLTCVGNDFGYQDVFARWVEALGRPGDVLFLMTTSGRSPNLINARDAADRLGLRTVALLGNTGGSLLGTCGFEWLVPDPRSERIQEIHQVLIHAIVDLIEFGVIGRETE